MVWIPSSAHAYPGLCVWLIPDRAYDQYDQVFTGRVLENRPLHRPVFVVDTILKGRKIQAGTTIELRINGWRPQLLAEGDRLTVPAHGKWVPHHGQKIHTIPCAPITDPIVNPAAYDGLSVIDSVFPPLSRYRS